MIHYTEVPRAGSLAQELQYAAMLGIRLDSTKAPEPRIIEFCEGKK